VKLAFVTLSNEGVRILEELLKTFPLADCFVHEKVDSDFECVRFSKIMELVAENFSSYKGFVFVAPSGAVVRALAKNLKDKKSDPAVVQVDVGGRFAVSLVGGHEGGANALTVMVANAICAEPVISTSTEAVKNIIVGVGCKKGKGAKEITSAIGMALDEAGVELKQVRFIASVDIKSNEKGLIETADTLQIPLRFISSDEIRNSTKDFAHSDFVAQKVNLPAVAEPVALIAGRRTSLLLQKKIYGGITVALAKENCLSLE